MPSVILELNRLDIETMSDFYFGETRQQITEEAEQPKW